MLTTHLPHWGKKILFSIALISFCWSSFADDDLFRHARALQCEGKYDEAIEAYVSYLSQPTNGNNFSDGQISLYPDALVQLMNTFQSKGAPEDCISTLEKVFVESPALQRFYLRDYYSVMGYALSRTEKMKEAEETTLKVFALPLHDPTPERLFRDYAYAASVFYSNPSYQNEVIEWCQEALRHSESCKNTSGAQWVTTMLGSAYKRNGQLNQALQLYQQSKEDAENKNDELAVLNSLHALTDLFIYWKVPEYANQYASEAIKVERNLTLRNPMVSAQTYINKGRALQQLGMSDSVCFYIETARKFCESLPYNSGLVDIDLLYGAYLTGKGGDSINPGIQKLQHVTRQGTAANRAKAYHLLAQTYLKCGKDDAAEIMLDSMYTLLNQGEAPLYIHIDYEEILNHFLKSGDNQNTEKYLRLMLLEQRILNEKRLTYNLVEAIVSQQTEQNRQELKIARLTQTTQRLWLAICMIVSILTISTIIIILLSQKKKHTAQMQLADQKLAMLDQLLDRSNAEKAMIEHEVDEMMSEKESRQELTSLTPSLLKNNGESKFRQRFEILYPCFLPRLREKIPSITRREELLAMLIILMQDNKEIAELMAIAPRSVLMLRHRFRQKIGLTTDNSLEAFIEDISGIRKSSDISSAEHPDS